jgi:hypothetical protein
MVAFEYNIKIKDIAKLTEGTWAKWSRDIQFSFAEAGLLGYLDSTIEAPKADGKKLVDWKEYNCRIIGRLGRIVDALAQELEMDMTAVDAWKLLERRTHQEGDGGQAEHDENHHQNEVYPLKTHNRHHRQDT